MPLVLALGRERQVDLWEFEASLAYRSSSRTAREILLKQNKTKQTNKQKKPNKTKQNKKLQKAKNKKYPQNKQANPKQNKKQNKKTY